MDRQNRNKDIETWNRLTAVRGEWGGGTGWKKPKELDKEQICMTHRHKQQCGDGQRGRGAGAGWRQGKQEKMGTSLIVSTIKMKKKNK